MTPQDEASALIADLTENGRMRILTAHETLHGFKDTISVTALEDGSVAVHANCTLTLAELKFALGVE